MANRRCDGGTRGNRPLQRLTMTNRELKKLITDLVGAYIERPSELQVVEQETADGKAVYWAIRADPYDNGMVIGFGGGHVDALEFLVERMGEAAGKRFTFRAITDEAPGTISRREPRTALEYDPTAVLKLLERLIRAVGVNASCIVGPGNGAEKGERNTLRYLFRIVPTTTADSNRLVQVYGARDPETDRGPNIIGAIGTLFRAMAKRDGVRFNLQPS